MQMIKILLLVCLQFGLKILYSLIFQLDSAVFTDYVGTSFKYSVLFIFFTCCFFFKCCFMLEHLCVYLEQESKEALATWVLVQIYTQSFFYACMSQLILVCNFACDLCCFIVNVYSVKSSSELMLYCFIMCRIKIKFSYLILILDD